MRLFSFCVNKQEIRENWNLQKREVMVYNDNYNEVYIVGLHLVYLQMGR